MSRAVTADHVMFNECIPVFRSEKMEVKTESNDRYGYLLLDFSLEQSIDFSHFSIKPTIEVTLPGAYSAFIAQVVLPNWFEEFDSNTHLFTIALSAIISFVSGRPIKAPRDGYMRWRQLDNCALNTLAIQHPVLTAGPGLMTHVCPKKLLKR
ncbi:MAG: hypothetical protein APF77_15005 [Clostridia bacterium BRH_c25]|nr:MAG: hypothetical protein APF77_15005 [Clostridia bacterium BRH_c25]